MTVDFESSDFVVVSTTVADAEQARLMATEIVARRLAACVQMIPVDSVYRWQGKIENAAEVSLHAKTPRAAADELVRYIRGVHPYEVPEILVVPIIAGDADYLAWIVEEVTSSTPDSRPL